MPSLVEIVYVVPEKEVFECRQCIFTISFLSPLGKVEDPLFEKKNHKKSLFKRRQCIFAIFLSYEKGVVL